MENGHGNPRKVIDLEQKRQHRILQKKRKEVKPARSGRSVMGGSSSKFWTYVQTILFFAVLAYFLKQCQM